MYQRLFTGAAVAFLVAPVALFLSPRSVAAKRGKKVSDILGRRDTAQGAAAPAVGKVE